MPFSNFSIDINTLPHQEEISLHPIATKFKVVQWWNWAIVWLIISSIFIGILLLTKLGSNLLAVIGIVTGLVLISLLHKILQLLSFRNRAFALREHDIVYQQGWLIKQKKFCPVSRIQHCSISSSFIERKQGLATLNIYTAGGNGADVSVRGLTSNQAALLKEMIIKKVGIDDSI